MAATTTLLGLVTPTQGTLSGTWGDTVNYGISDYVDISVAGTLTLTNDGAVTLANTTGSSSGNSITSSLTGAGTVTAQFAIVKVTGTLTVAKVVTGPSYSKTYTVVNSATGGIVTFKASGQTGVSIAVGESAFVYFNGTDYVKLTGTATAGAAGGSNTQVQFNSSGVLAGSSNMTFNGTTLTVNDLTDSSLTATRVVYAGTAGNLTNSANMTFDGTTLTSTGFAGPLNGTVGATTANTGAFTTVTASSTGTFSGLLSRIHAQGTDAYISTTTTGKANTVMGFNDSGSTNAQGVPTAYAYYGNLQTYPIAFTTNGALTYVTSSTAHTWYISGTRSMDLNSTGLGIGTSSPATKVHAVATGGAIRMQDNIGNAKYIQMRSDVTNSHLEHIGGPGDALIINNQAAGVIAFYTSNTERARITSAGALSVNATSAINNLVTLGTPLTTYTPQLAFQSTANTQAEAFIGSGSNAHNIWVTAGAEPTGDADSSNWATARSTVAAIYRQRDANHIWFTNTSLTVGTTYTPTERMRITNAGNLIVGSTGNLGRIGSVLSDANTTFSNLGYGMLGLTNTSNTNNNYTWMTFNESNTNYVAAIGSQNQNHAPASGAVYGDLLFATKTNGLGGFPTEKMRLTSEGYLLINTTTSNGYKVNVRTNAGATALDGEFISDGTRNLILAQSGSTYNYASISANENVVYASGNPLNIVADSSLIKFSTGNERMRITNAGNVGIGNSAPTGNLHIGNGSTVGDQDLYVQSDSANRPRLRLWGGTSNKLELSIGGTADINVVASVPLVFYTNNTERARIDTSGNLLVGATSTSGTVGNYANVLGGLFKSFSGSVSAATNTYVTLFGASGGTIASYLVSVWVGADDVANYQANVIVNTQGGSSTKVTTIVSGNLLIFQMSGYNLQAAQLSGGTATINYSAIRIGA
jgi:hypothetical protein